VSDFIEHVKSSRPRTAIKAPAPKTPLIDTSKSSPSVAVMGDIINNAAAPFQEGPDPKKGTLGKIEHGIGAVMGVVGAPFELLDTGFALVTAPLAALMPGFPAATLLAPHLGMLHGHAHPPSLIPPAVVPIPLPSIGTVMCAGAVSVLIGGIPAARAGDVGLAVTCGSLSPAFEIYTGSSNTFIGGSRAARMGTDITRHCNPASALGKLGAVMGGIGVVAGAISAGASASAGESLQASMQAAQAAADAAALAMSALLGKDPGVPPALGVLLLGNPTVLIGGFPLPDLLDVLGAALKGLKKLGKAVNDSPSFKKLIAKVGLCNDKGEPVSSFSGAVYNDFDDYRAPSGFSWERHYESRWNLDDGPLGYGFRHFFDRRLELLRTRAVYEAHDGERLAFPLDASGRYVSGQGYAFERLATGRHLLRTDRDEELEFLTQPTSPPSGRLVRYRRAAFEVLLSCDEQGRLQLISEPGGAFPIDTRLVYDASDRIIEVQRGPRGATPQIISRYAYQNGCLVTWQDALGATARMRYDGARRMVQGTDRRGYSFHWQYDPTSGRCIKSHGDDGLWGIEASYEGDRSIFKERDGGEWIFKHFPDGIVSHVVDPLGGMLEYVRDEQTGRIIKQITPAGTEYAWLYDASGKHFARRGPFGHLLPPEDEDPNPPNPLAHDGPTSPKEFLLGRPLAALPNALGGLPSAVRQRLEPALRSGSPTPLPEPTRNALARVIEQPERGGTVRRFEYDAEGNVIAEQDTGGSWTRSAYSSWNLLSQRTSALGHATRYEHTHRGEWHALIDPNGNRTEYVRDPLHRVIEIRRYGGVYRRYIRDAHDGVAEEQDASGNTLIKYEAGPHGLPVAATLASGERYSYAYDARGRFTLASSTQHQVVRRYAGKCLELDLRDDKGIRHEYGPGQRLRSTTVLQRFVIRYDDSKSSTLRIATPDGSNHALWHQQHCVVRENGNGTNEASVFDSDDRLAARACWSSDLSAHGPSSLVSYHYDARGCLVSIVDMNAGPVHFEFDADRRVVAQHDHRGERRYSYDAAGNLTSTARYRLVEYEPGNLVQHADFDHFEHDERYRRSQHDRQGGAVVTYLYDSRDQLIEARWSDRIELWRSSYDGLGRRLWREYAGQRTDFYWDGDRLAAERNPDGQLRVYVYPNEDALVPFMWLDYASENAPPESGKASYLFTSPSGMPTRVEDARGRLVWQARALDAYGELDESSSRCPTRLRFAGHFFDEHLGLFYNRFRDYDPALGRYLQPDRLGHTGSINLFAYPTNPLVDVDLRGLMHRGGKKKGNKGKGNEDAAPTEEVDVEAQKQKQREAEQKRRQEKLAEAQAQLDAIGPIGPRARADIEGMPGGRKLLDSIDAEPDPIKKLEQTQVAAVALESHRKGEPVTALEKPYKNPDGSDLTKTDVETDRRVIEVKGKDLSDQSSLNKKGSEQATADRKVARDSGREHVIRAPSANDGLADKIEKRGTTVDRTPFPYDLLKE
jgi:RHS repeat-associated protein